MQVDDANIPERQGPEERHTLPIFERDKAILQVFVVFVSSLAVAAAITYSDISILVLGLTSLVLAYLLISAYSHELSNTIKLYINPLEEATLIILLYLTAAWVVLPLLEGFGVLFSGILLLIGSIPIVLILTRGWGQSLKPLFFGQGDGDEDNLTKVVLMALVIVFLFRLIPLSRALPLLITPEIFTRMISLIISLGIITGFVEELVFRAIAQPRLSQYFGSRVMGLLVSSTIFAFLHFVSDAQYSRVLFDPVSSMLSALLTRLGFGLTFGAVWVSSNKITHPWAIHTIHNSLYSILRILEAL